MTQQLFSSVTILLNLFIYFVFCVHYTVKSENITDANLNIWSSLLEQYTVESLDQSRQGKHLQKQYSSNGRVYITRRIGEAYDPEVRNDRPTVPYQKMQPPPPVTRTRPFPQIMKRIDNQPTKPLNFRPNGRIQPTEISETDLYLLGAIEKLVYRVDYLEKRLKKTDELVLYLMEKQHQQESATHQQSQVNQKPNYGQQAQPAILNSTQQLLNKKDSVCQDNNSTKIGENCYLVVYTPSTDWQSASQLCKSKSSFSQLLLEFDSYKEYYDVGLFLKSNKKYRKHNYWLGGLNPGLLWIWSSSAKPVNPFKNELISEKSDAITIDTKDTNLTDIHGSGRCLSYSFNSTSKNYMYYGQNCNLKMGYLCKVLDLTVENEISRVAKILNGNV